MTPPITLSRARASCLLAWSVALLIPIGILLGIGLPWWSRVSGLDEQIVQRQDRIHRYQSLLATLPRLRAELKHESNREDVKAFYYEANTQALAGAQIQRSLQDMTQKAGAKLVNTQSLPAGNEQPPRVRVRAQLQGDTDALLELLLQIEQARPFLFVDQLSVRTSARRTRRSTTRGRAAANNRRSRQTASPGLLTIRLDVSGYALGAKE